MPFAKGVSAKSHEFDAEGNEIRTDYLRMMKIVLDAGYHGYVGIEWEGGEPDEKEGTLLTKRLLERCATRCPPPRADLLSGVFINAKASRGVPTPGARFVPPLRLRPPATVRARPIRL